MSVFFPLSEGDALAPLSRRWLIAAGCMTLFIWGNSLVPGTGSSHLSLSVVSMARSWLSGMGLPSAWLTNLLVRKMAHFSEYALLIEHIGSQRFFDRSEAFDAPFCDGVRRPRYGGLRR